MRVQNQMINTNKNNCNQPKMQMNVLNETSGEDTSVEAKTAPTYIN